jgi:hypothetical protein
VSQTATSIAGPVRLTTGEESSATPAPGMSPLTIAGLSVAGLGVLVALVVAVIHVRRKWPTRSEASLDAEAAKALAKKLGLARRDRATVWELAAAEGSHSPLDLLVSVKKLSIAASKRATTLTNESAREALRELCKALDAEVPTFTAAGTEKTTNGARKQGTSPRTAPRSAVVTPRLIDRRG